MSQSLQEESRQNSLFRCKELETIMMVSWCWEQQTSLGYLMRQSEEDLKREFTLICQRRMPGNYMEIIKT